MDKRRLARQILFTLMMPVTGCCAYPTVEEAHTLFATELMNSTKIGAMATILVLVASASPLAVIMV